MFLSRKISVMTCNLEVPFCHGGGVSTMYTVSVGGNALCNNNYYFCGN